MAADDLRHRLLSASKRTLNRSLSKLLIEAANAIPASLPLTTAKILDFLVESGKLSRADADSAMKIVDRWPQ